MQVKLATKVCGKLVQEIKFLYQAAGYPDPLLSILTHASLIHEMLVEQLETERGYEVKAAQKHGKVRRCKVPNKKSSGKS